MSAPSIPDLLIATYLRDMLKAQLYGLPAAAQAEYVAAVLKAGPTPTDAQKQAALDAIQTILRRHGMTLPQAPSFQERMQ
jgi:hypothetical protein